MSATGGTSVLRPQIRVKQARGHVVVTGSVTGCWTLAGPRCSATKWEVSAIGYGLREENNEPE